MLLLSILFDIGVITLTKKSFKVIQTQLAKSNSYSLTDLLTIFGSYLPNMICGFVTFFSFKTSGKTITECNKAITAIGSQYVTEGKNDLTEIWKDFNF